MKPTKKNSFLDLSKLSEEQQRKVIALLPIDNISAQIYFMCRHEDWNVIKKFTYLFFNDNKVWQICDSKREGKQELTYTQFIEMMGGETSTEIETFTLEDFISFGKQCFYSGFEKSEKDYANCFTAWREEASGLLTEFKSKQ